MPFPKCRFSVVNHWCKWSDRSRFQPSLPLQTSNAHVFMLCLHCSGVMIVDDCNDHYFLPIGVHNVTPNAILDFEALPPHITPLADFCLQDKQLNPGSERTYS